jgi:hypothetical protein
VVHDRRCCLIRSITPQTNNRGAEAVGVAAALLLVAIALMVAAIAPGLGERVRVEIQGRAVDVTESARTAHARRASVRVRRELR